MTPQNETEIIEYARRPIPHLEPPTLALTQIAGRPDAEALATGHLGHVFDAAVPLFPLRALKGAALPRAASIDEKLRYTSKIWNGLDAITSYWTDERLFGLAAVYRLFLTFFLCVMVGGVAIVLNTVSALVSGSGTIPSLVDAPLRAAAFAFIPLAGMLAGHIAHHLCVVSSAKRIVTWILVGTTLACTAAWCVAFVHAFPLPGTGTGAINVFEDGARSDGAVRSLALTVLVTVQLVGEITFGALVGIVVENFMTAGRKERVKRNLLNDAYDEETSDLAHRLGRANLLIGTIDDFERRRDAARAEFIERGLAYLAEVQLSFRHARDEFHLSLISKAAATRPQGRSA